MGLFSKNPAEKRLKELAGGMFLNSSFKKKLSEAGLTNADGFIIQNEIKESIKRKELLAEGIETRINFLIRQKQEAKRARNEFSKNSGLGNNIKSKEEETKARLLNYIDGNSMDNSLKVSFKNDVRQGKIRDRTL